MATVTESGSAAGWLTITTPIELQVFDGGQLVGTTGTSRLMLPAGRHELEVVSPSLEFRSPLSVQLAAGKTTVSNVVLPNGLLSINALPWADVSIDGRSAGTTPLGNLSVPIGTHEIVWHHPQLGDRRQTVTVKSQSPARAAIDYSRP